MADKLEQAVCSKENVSLPAPPSGFPCDTGRALTCAGSSSDTGERCSTPHGTSWPGGKTTALGQQCICREVRPDAPARHAPRGREQVAQGQCGAISGAGQEAPDSQPSGSS